MTVDSTIVLDIVDAIDVFVTVCAAATAWVAAGVTALAFVAFTAGWAGWITGVWVWKTTTRTPGRPSWARGRAQARRSRPDYEEAA